MTVRWQPTKQIMCNGTEDPLKRRRDTRPWQVGLRPDGPQDLVSDPHHTP